MRTFKIISGALVTLTLLTACGPADDGDHDTKCKTRKPASAAYLAKGGTGGGGRGGGGRLAPARPKPAIKPPAPKAPANKPPVVIPNRHC